MKIKLSIIIPVYKVEEYITTCLDTIFRQGVNEDIYEVIFINDGSPDNSSTLIKEAQEYHSNIILIEQENAGVSAARNKGLEISQGEYVMFIDPDDCLKPGSLGKIVDYISKENGADLVICRSFKNGTEYQPWKHKFIQSVLYKGIDILNKGYLRTSVWGGIYKRSILTDNGILFLEGVKNGEDTIFTMHVMFYTEKISFEDIELYEVTIREGSASRNYTKERIFSMVDSLDKVSALVKDLDACIGDKSILCYMLYTQISNLIRDTVLTKDIGWSLLKKSNVNSFFNRPINKEVRFLRRKMFLLKYCFSLFYFMIWISNKPNRT